MATSISMGDVIDRQTAVLKIPKMVREDEYGYRTCIEAKSILPDIVLPLNQDFNITSTGGSIAVTLKRFADGFYTCSCPAWKFSAERDKFRKTCAHLQDLLGRDYETQRIAIAKESKSKVWESSSSRRTISDSAQVRHTQAKSLLDNHYRQLSQSQPSRSGGPTNLTRETLRTKAEPNATNSKASQEKDHEASKSTLRGDDSSGSGTEEEEDGVPSSLRSTTLQANPKQLPGGPSKHHVHDSSDDDDDLDTQTSPSKRARRRKVLSSDDDNKVSLLLAKGWPLEVDPSKPRSKAMDPTSWWLSEKLDGVRAFWDGNRLYSRQKIEWNAPAWWKARLPKDITLDGELWMARGTFDRTSQICRSTVRLGRLRTFQHHLKRDSMERQWLREQVGGKQASQERVRVRQRAQQVMTDLHGGVSQAGSIKPRLDSWKALKRVKMGVRKVVSGSQDDKTRLKLAQSFLHALVGVASADHRTSLTSRTASRRQKVVRRCAGCGKRLRSKQSHCLSNPAPAGDARNVSKVHTDHSSLAIPDIVNTNMPSNVPIRRLAHPFDAIGPRRSTLASSRGCRGNMKTSTEWSHIKFMIFDAPSMGSLPVEDRWAELEKCFGSTADADIDDLEGAQIKLVRHIRCQSKEHLLELMAQVESKGGEGLMLRKPKSRYEGRRGTTLYKLKSWYDAEAEVVGYADGSGRFQGHAGSLVARMECGTVFRVGTGMSDAMRHNPPPLGTIINYRFFELSEDGYPRFPAFRGIARDKTRAKDALVRPRAATIRAENEKSLHTQTM